MHVKPVNTSLAIVKVYFRLDTPTHAGCHDYFSMSTKAKLNANGKAPGSRRDNFTQAVIQILYKRAGGKCCRCAAPTFGPVSNNPLKSVNIGQAAHIAAAAPLGPRYLPTMSLEERTSAANGMWMCSNCHDIIDRDVNEYPTSTLKKMKYDAEKRAKNEMGVASRLVSKQINMYWELNI